MIALDTNVLVRYLVDDDPEQGVRAAACVDGAIARGEGLFISEIVVCELVWVLESAYRFPKDQIVEVLDRLLKAEQVSYQQPDLLLAALAAFRTGPADFADYLIREQARTAGCSSLVSFDKNLLQEPGTMAP